MATVDLQSTNESGMLYYDHQLIKEQLDGLDTSDSINDKLNTQQTYTDNYGLLGEIRQIALSITGALTKSQLQARGWAICDGTTPESQGISSPTITATPDLREKFLRHSANEVTGGTGGANSYTLAENQMPAHTHSFSAFGSGSGGAGAAYGVATSGGTTVTTSSKGGTTTINNQPAYYDICYFMKVK